jgi:GH24 family phage-related lysozyme (muramidase)
VLDISVSLVTLSTLGNFDKHYHEAIHVIGGDHVFENLPEPIQRVIVNMCFNLGGSRLSKFRKMIEACQHHDWEEMAVQMEDSRWFKQVGRRSKELQAMVLEQV